MSGKLTTKQLRFQVLDICNQVTLMTNCKLTVRDVWEMFQGTKYDDRALRTAIWELLKDKKVSQ